jgi:bacterioferritin-associated ferredoxin
MPMFICLCNALDDVQLGRAIRDGARRPRDAYLACGCRAQCGVCTTTILGMIRDGAPATRGVDGGQEQ